MRKHLNEYVFSPLSWLLTIIIILLIILVLTFITPFGVKTLSYLVDSSLKELTVKGVSGSLLTGLKVDEIIWDDQGDSISLRDVDLNLKHYNTSRGRLVANKVRAGRLNINLSNRKSEDVTVLPNFGLPLNINAHLVELDSLQITQDVPGEEESRTLLFQVRDIALKKVTVNEGNLRFRQLSGKPIILNQPLNINVRDGKLNMDYPHNITTDGDINYKHPEFGNLEGDIELAGTLTNYNFKGSVNHQQVDLGLQTIKFQGEGDYKRVHLEKVTLDGEHGIIDAKGRAVFAPDITWAFKVDGKDLSTKKFLEDWPATVDADLRFMGSYVDGRVENNIRVTSIEGTLREYNLKLTGDVSEKSGSLELENMALQVGDNYLELSGKANEPFDLNWNIDAQNIKEMLPDKLAHLNVAGSVKGSGKVEGSVNKPLIKISASAQDLVYEEFKQAKESLDIDGELLIDNGVLQLKEVLLKSGANTIEASGQASEPFDLEWDINAIRLERLLPTMSGETLLAGKLKGKGSIVGSVEQAKLKLNVSANDLVYRETSQGEKTISLSGELDVKNVINNNVLQLKNVILKSGENELLVSGQVSEPLKLDVTLNANNLVDISPDLNGTVASSLLVLGSYDAPIIKGNVNATNLRYKESRIGDSEIRAQGEVQLVEGAPIIKNLATNIGSNRLNISGRASSPYDLNWDIDGKNLSQILPGMSGYLIAKGKLGGTLENPILNATVDAKNVQYEDFKLGSADVVAQTNNGIYKIKGNLVNLQNGSQSLSKAMVDLNGRIESHTIVASADHGEGKVRLKANGGWSNANWKGILQTFRVNETQAGDWQLRKPTQLTISDNSFSSGNLCFSGVKSHRSTRVCSTTSWSQNAGLKSQGTLSKTPLDLFKPWLPEGLTLNGSVGGRYNIQQNKGKPKGTIELTLPDSSFSFESDDGEQKTFGYKNAEITTTINDKNIKTKATMNIVNRGKLVADVGIKLSPQNGKHTIKGIAKLDVPNINWAQEFIPRSRGLQGSLDSELSFSGLLSKPQIKGKIDLKNAFLRLPEAGTELTNINLKVRSNKAGTAKITGTMLMGRGLLNVSGDLDAKDINKWKANVKVTGNNILFMNTNEVKARMTPDIIIGVTPDIVSFTGKILIPTATIKLKKIPEISIDENSDAYVIGERKKGENVSAVRIQPKLLIELGDKVQFDAFGLDAKLSGSMNISHNRRDILANGSLRVSEGKYEAYGQDLAIDNGRLIFNGSPKQIGVDVRATRKVDDTVVGIHLGGTLLNPKSTIYSDPTLPESEALSYLLTGHSLSTTSGTESALLMSAVRGLGISGSNSLIHNIGSSLGLDDVNIVSGQDLNQSKLQLGKQLGSRLYVKYLIGLFDQTQKISVEYKINKVFSLEAQTSSDNNYGLDLIYEIERD